MTNETKGATVRSLEDVLEERSRQDEKWGEQNHDPFTYITILAEEFGELAKCALHVKYGGNEAAGLREEAVQVAAVALAIVECIDRGKWTWPCGPEIEARERERCAKIAGLFAASSCDPNGACEGKRMAESIASAIRSGE